YDHAHCVLGPQRYSDAASRGLHGLSGLSGVRLGGVASLGTPIHRVAIATGTVEVRSNEVLIIEETKNGTATGRSTNLPGFLALDYQGTQAGVSKWLQFIWSQIIIKVPGVANPVIFPGSLPAIGGSQRPLTKDATNPQWVVDAASTTDPFYESAGGLAN